MRKIKYIWAFIKVFLISFLVMELIEFLIKTIFNVDLHGLKIGWFGFLLLYGFKYHILCCLLPAIWTTYKCKHKTKCNHKYCD